MLRMPGISYSLFIARGPVPQNIPTALYGARPWGFKGDKDQALPTGRSRPCGWRGQTVGDRGVLCLSVWLAGCLSRVVDALEMRRRDRGDPGGVKSFQLDLKMGAH